LHKHYLHFYLSLWSSEELWKEIINDLVCNSLSMCAAGEAFSNDMCRDYRECLMAKLG